MKSFLGIVGAVSVTLLPVLLWGTFFAAVRGATNTEDLLSLVEAVFSWQVILGGVGVGSGWAFGKEIRAWLTESG
jgi:hypothetical protein